MPFPSNLTSNDLLSDLAASHVQDKLNYVVIAQCADEVQDIQNAPAVSMGPYLLATDAARLLTTLSIYMERGDSREQLRLLYMNETALKIWRAMGKQARIAGWRHRPPQTALLAFGVPFSE